MKVLEHDDLWSKFLQHCGQSRKHCAKTALAFLSPPTVRDQARYMNLPAGLNWASDMRRFLNGPVFNQGVSVEPWRITIEFKWLEEFADSVAQWRRRLEMIEQVVHYVRWEGYYQNAVPELAQRVDHLRGDTLGDPYRRAARPLAFRSSSNLAAPILRAHAANSSVAKPRRPS